eukprot:jgi/Galph1/442/GphlegSOOS_G5162.1
MEPFSKELVLFVIDVRENMYEKNEENEPLVILAIRCVKELYKSRILEKSDDLLGVLLFGTTKNNNPNDLQNIYVLLELDVPDAESILYLETLENEPELIASQFGRLKSYEKLKFHEMLFTCRSLVNHVARKSQLASRRLFLFTNDGEPVEDSREQKTLSIQQARDLSDSGIVIELFPLKGCKSKSFEYQAFFEDVLGERNKTRNMQPVNNPVSNITELNQQIRTKQYKKRALLYSKLYLDSEENDKSTSETLAAGIEVFALYHRTIKGRKVLLEARNNEPVRRINIKYSEESGALVTDLSEIGYSFPFAGIACVFTQKEMENLRQLCQSGLHLIGFEDANKLKWQHSLKPSYFIYPSDRQIQGSQLLLSVLWKQMLETNQIAIVRVYLRNVSYPRLGALVPQEELHDETYFQPSGFHLLWLPFADDIRKEWKTTYPSIKDLPSEHCIESAKEVISKLSLPKYTGLQYSNPDIQRYYNGLEALALNQSEMKEVQDNLKINEELVNAACKALEAWKSIVTSQPLEMAVYNKEPQPLKGSHLKRQREQDAARKYLDQLKLNWKALASGAAGEELGDLNMNILKMFCTANGLPKSGRKADVVERIRSYLDSENLCTGQT